VRRSFEECERLLDASKAEQWLDWSAKRSWRE
jgi:phage terminase small subunit